MKTVMMVSLAVVAFASLSGCIPIPVEPLLDMLPD
jgi:hypothetical protein